MQAKVPEATQAQGKPAAGAPIRGVSLEDRAAQAKELAAFWARQAQLLNDKLHEDKTAQAAHGFTATEKQGKQHMREEHMRDDHMREEHMHGEPSHGHEPKHKDGPAPEGPTQGASNEDEGKEVTGQTKPGQGEIVKDEIGLRSVDTEQKTECKAECKAD